jgi:hypothetical protein
VGSLGQYCNISDVFFNTDVRLLRGDWIKIVFVSVCGNLQHIYSMTKAKIFKVFCFLVCTSAMLQNAAKMSYTNFRVTSLTLTRTSLV